MIILEEIICAGPHAQTLHFRRGVRVKTEDTEIAMFVAEIIA